MTETRGRPYPVDGESFAHGQAIDVTYTYDYDDIYEAMLESLWFKHEPEVYDTFNLDEVCVELGDYLSALDLKRLNYLLEEKLIDDEYGTQKHQNIVEEFLDSYLPKDAEAIFETTEMR